MSSKETEWLERKGKQFSGDRGRYGGTGVAGMGGGGVMGMVLGHVFNHVTMRVPAWETRLCFLNPTDHHWLTLLSSLNQQQQQQQNSTLKNIPFSDNLDKKI